MTRCEWNPAHHIPAWWPGLHGDCLNDATVTLGAKGDWHLCASCAALPEFRRFKVRRKLERSAKCQRS